MTSVTFVFLTLFSWMVSSSTWLRLDQCAVLSQHDEEVKGFSSNASYKSTVILSKTKLTLTCERSPVMNVGLEEIFTQDSFKNDCITFPGVTLKYSLFNGCANLLQRVIGDKQIGHVCNCLFHQLLRYFLSNPRYYLLPTEVKSDNHNTHLNYISFCSSSVFVAHDPHIITSVSVDYWKKTDCTCIHNACNLEVKILPNNEHGPVFPEFFIFNLPESTVILMSAEESQAYVRVFYMQMPSKFYAPQCLKEAPLKRADCIRFTACMGRVESVQTTDTRWVARFFLAAVLLLGICMTVTKISPCRVGSAHGSNSTMVMLFTMTLHCFSPSVNIHQNTGWSRIAVGISFVICLSCALGRAVHVLIACRAAHPAMKLFCLMTEKPKVRALPVTMLFIWLTFSHPFPDKTVKHWFEGILVEGNAGSTLRSWTVLGHIELFAILFCVFVSLPSLLQSILMKFNFFSVLLNMQVVTCLHNPRIPTKYVLVIRINRLI